MPQLSCHHLLGIKALTDADIELLMSTSAEFYSVLQRPIKKVPSLRDKTIANLFFENSTRTRLSFELAEKRLSADVINFSASGSSLSKGETLLDTVNNILAMKVDMIVLRHSSPGAGIFLAKHLPRFKHSAQARIINAGDGTHEHPTQALLDAFSLQQSLGSLNGKKVALVGDILHSRVALSNLLLLQKMGVHVELCAPPSLLPKGIEKLGVRISHSLDQTLQRVDAVNMLRIQEERLNVQHFPSAYEYHRLFGLNMERWERLQHKPIILHPGPVNRGVELDGRLADSANSIILDQVQHGVAVRMAVLYLLGQHTTADIEANLK
ncbi:MAG: aspartate carbamoyltransferase catalytic subunit [Bacteroidetes bacterium]|jgi:aspartate carbamoyltransferase catalytic subunit|nr:aspartate carbamoyltransferase catalytic subunit [Bacteroidota bacterium]